MRLPRFEYFAPRSVEEALDLLADRRDAVVKAGGTDLIPRLKWKLENPEVLIDLKAVPELNFIRRDNQGDLCIGALTPLRSIETSSVVRECFGALADAVSQIAAPEIRNMGTLGGNICLETRCQFYNQSPFFRKGTEPCLKAGGSTCYISRKGNRCYSLFCADSVPLLMAAGAELTIMSSGGERRLPLHDLYTDDGEAPLALSANELLAEIRIPKSVETAPAAYLKYRFRESIDFPVIGVAVYGAPGMEQGHSDGIRVVVVGAGSRPLRCLQAEEILRKGKIDRQVLDKAGSTAAEEIQVVSSSGCSISYRKILIKQLVIRGVQAIRG